MMTITDRDLHRCAKNAGMKNAEKSQKQWPENVDMENAGRNLEVKNAGIKCMIG